MAKAQYVGVDSVARKVKQPYHGVDGVARKVKSGYVGVNGVARQFFSSGVPIGSLWEGDWVYLNVNGTPKQFVVVNQGRPYLRNGYDQRSGTGLDGAWLLMDNLDKKIKVNEFSNYFSTFLNSLDTKVQDIIHETELSGNKKIFSLSYDEVGFGRDVYDSNYSDGHAPLSYFSWSGTIAYYNGTASPWWLRTGYSSTQTTYVGDNGYMSVGLNSTHYCHARPAFILPSDTLVTFDGMSYELV